MNRKSLFLLAIMGGLTLGGCEGENKQLATPQQSDLEKYLADNPDAANAAMAELDE